MKNTKYIRSGNVVVTLHHDKNSGTHKVGYVDGGKRVFRGAGKNAKAARAFAQNFADKIATGLPPVLPFAIPVAPGTAGVAHPMTVEGVVKDLITLKLALTTVPKAGGGIVSERLKSLQFAGRILIHLHPGRLIDTITAAELQHNYADLANGKIDLTSIYDPAAKNKAKPGKPRNPVTVNTYFNRINSFFVHARRLKALPPDGPTACWTSLTGKSLNQKTSQKPYTAAEMARLLPLLEEKEPQLVRPVVFLLEGGRICELAARDRALGSNGYFYLMSKAVTFGLTVERGSWIAIETGSIEVSADLAKDGRFEGKARYIVMTRFGARYFQKYAQHSDVIIPLRFWRRKGVWIQEPTDVSRAISRFIDAHEKELGFCSRRNGFRHFSGSIRPLLQGPEDSALSMGHSPKIGKAFYNHQVNPSEAVNMDQIYPLIGPALPAPPCFGTEAMRRDMARKSTPRGGNVPLVESGPLLMEFKELYEQACDTSHGWQNRLAQLLDCSDSNVAMWWTSMQGKQAVERAPSKVYVDKLKDLLADKTLLMPRLNLRDAELEITSVRITKLEPFYLQSGFKGTFALWLAKLLPPVTAQISLDWIQGKRPASKTHLARLDGLICRLELQPPLSEAA